MKLSLQPSNEVRQSRPVLNWHVPPVRTYEEIARILQERGQAKMEPATVLQICSAAISKVARAFMADPLIRTGLLQPRQRLHGEGLKKKA